MLTPAEVSAALLDDMGYDNGCVFLPCVSHYRQLDLAVVACQREGLKFTADSISLIAYGDVDEANEAFSKYPSYSQLNAVLTKIFDDCRKCHNILRRRG